jgi:hypothetical protein
MPSENVPETFTIPNQMTRSSWPEDTENTLVLLPDGIRQPPEPFIFSPTTCEQPPSNTTEELKK